MKLPGSGKCQGGGLSALKLYGMVGIPGEEPADVDQTVAMMRDIKKSSRITLDTRMQHVCSRRTFQWFGVNPQAEKRLQVLQKQLRSHGIDFRPESYNWSVIQALLSRGSPPIPPLELTRHYGDQHIAAPSNSYGATS